MFNKKIEEYIRKTGEGVVLDYVNGQFILENKSFVEGKNIPACDKIQAVGSTLELCLDNFVYFLEQKDIREKNKNNFDIESYLWYCSY